TALACHYRAALADARMGLPEITLGIIPGAGATQRLPRLIGAMKTFELMIAGAPIGAEEAKALGLIDEIVSGDPIGAGLAYAQALIAKGARPRRTGELPARADGFDAASAAAVIAKNARALKGRTTQHAAVKVVQAALDAPNLAEGLKSEDAASQASLQTRESQALRHIFFAERECARVPGLANVAPLAIGKAAVIGAGTMGSGIATAFADAGLPVALIDVNRESLDRGLAAIRGNYEANVARGRMGAGDVEKRMALITGALDASAAADADVAVEAVFENMDLKKRVLADLDRAMKPHALIATNTSTLSVSELAGATGRPGQVIGLHFFSPAHVMKLLEIVRGRQTAPQTIVTALDIARRLRKTGVVSADSFGFIGNKMMQDGYFREAEQLLLEGASPEQIDAVMESWGFAMGPNKVNDMAGVDVGTLVREELFKRETRPRPYFAVSDALTPLGRLGQKTGKGIYLYKPGDRNAYPDPEVTALIEKLAADHGIKRRAISDAEIEERCLLPLINIGADLLEQGVAYRASDIDVVWTSGYGFPRYFGGPMFYGDTLGLKHVLARVEHYHAKLGAYWKPSNLLRQLAESGTSFTQYDQAKAAAPAPSL
ncbi:MAG TPA: 3-hydroxyacyl-CoA dehydrogenase NAD-binding domain-containing protein, partial [Caulobacterales bacterium]|nr:3-hydroxyacyl-CoA dehydrogenase NAD-binding domain-containing protein [Caulobacterales bacterium]